MVTQSEGEGLDAARQNALPESRDNDSRKDKVFCFNNIISRTSSSSSEMDIKSSPSMFSDAGGEVCNSTLPLFRGISQFLILKNVNLISYTN